MMEKLHPENDHLFILELHIIFGSSQLESNHDTLTLMGE
jgi:hypothetical protein